MTNKKLKEIRVFYQAIDEDNRLVASTTLSIGAGMLMLADQSWSEAKKVYKQLLSQLKKLKDSLKNAGYENV